MGLQTRGIIAEQDLFTISSTQQGRLGEAFDTFDGRRFRYGVAGGVTLAPGKMNASAATVANHINIVGGTAAAVGDAKVTVTLGATAATADQYKGGYIWSNSTSTGQGYAYRIRTHAAIASSGTGVFYLDDPIQVAWTTTTKVSLCANFYSGAIVAPASASGAVPVGVAPVSQTTLFYGWYQVQGAASLLCEATVYTLGEEVCQSTATAGAGTLKVATQPTYGFAAQLGVSTEYQLVQLSLV